VPFPFGPHAHAESLSFPSHQAMIPGARPADAQVGQGNPMILADVLVTEEADRRQVEAVDAHNLRASVLAAPHPILVLLNHPATLTADLPAGGLGLRPSICQCRQHGYLPRFLGFIRYPVHIVRVVVGMFADEVREHIIRDFVHNDCV